MRRRGILFCFLALLILSAVGHAQSVSFKRIITVSDGSQTNSNTLTLGVNGDGPGGAILDNTVSADTDPAYAPDWDESQLPPTPPPPFAFDIRLLTPPGRVSTFPTGFGTGFGEDYRGFSSLNQIDTFRVQCQGSDVDNNGVIISWPSDLSSLASSWTIKPLGPPTFSATDMTSSTSVTVGAQFGPINFLVIVTEYSAPPPPGPTFLANPTTMSFGNVQIGQSTTKTLTIKNGGATNNLEISAMSLNGSASFSIVNAPGSFPVVIAPQATETYTVKFDAPATAGLEQGTLTITHNDPNPGTTMNIALEGNATTVAQNQLTFDDTLVYVNDKSVGNVAQISLANHDTSNGNLSALQFFVVSTKGGLLMTRVKRGAEIQDPSKWGFSYVIVNGQPNPDFSTQDTLKCVLLGFGQNVYSSGVHTGSLVDLYYQTVDIPGDTALGRLEIINVVGANRNGQNLGINPGDGQTICILNNAGITKGDANLDGTVNILDILTIIDHILQIQELEGEAFQRADVAPWPNSGPIGDQSVDAGDLALLQTIIVDGQYPNGTLLSLLDGSLSKSSNRIEVFTEVRDGFLYIQASCEVPVRGFEIEMMAENCGDILDSPFDIAVSNTDGSNLHAVLYNTDGQALKAGIHTVARIPVDGHHAVSKVIAADMRNLALDVQISSARPINAADNIQLLQNHPNPFRDRTIFTITQSTNVTGTVSVYSLLGERLATFPFQPSRAGIQNISWNGTDDAGKSLPAGTYIYRLEAGSTVQSRLLTIVQ